MCGKGGKLYNLLAFIRDILSKARSWHAAQPAIVVVAFVCVRECRANYCCGCGQCCDDDDQLLNWPGMGGGRISSLFDGWMNWIGIQYIFGRSWVGGCGMCRMHHTIPSWVTIVLTSVDERQGLNDTTGLDSMHYKRAEV